MSLIEYQPDEGRYIQLFAVQHGYGMPKYRGSPMSGGNFWGHVIGFAKGLFSRVAPHLSSALLKAQPHARTLGSKAMASVLDSAIEKVQEKLKLGQQGKGFKGR